MNVIAWTKGHNCLRAQAIIIIHHLQLLTVYSGTLVLAAAVSFTDFDVGWG